MLHLETTDIINYLSTSTYLQKRCGNRYWSLEEYHKSFKQNVGITKSSNCTMVTQKNSYFVQY